MLAVHRLMMTGMVPTLHKMLQVPPSAKKKLNHDIVLLYIVTSSPLASSYIGVSPSHISYNNEEWRISESLESKLDLHLDW